MLLSVQDFQPFDTIPNELVVEIFARALVVPPGETPDGKKPVTRMSLSHVCRRWKDILQSHVCIGVPEDHHFMLSKDVLESGYVSVFNPSAKLTICDQRVELAHLLCRKIRRTTQTYHYL